jgi:hypothetical protein
MMKEVCLKSQRLTKILSGITEDVFKEENIKRLSEEARRKEKKDNLITDLHSVDDAYFRKALKYPLKDFAYPRAALGIGTISTDSDMSSFFHELVAKKLMRLQNTVGSAQNALCMLYPDDGYIGWHHNGNAPGYNVLFSYSQDGDGHFKYYDKEKDEVVYIYDKPGWNVKCGYYPSEVKEPNRVYWHAASTKKARLSIAFVINNRDMWVNMIEYITNNEHDKSAIESQGPLNHLKSNGYI